MSESKHTPTFVEFLVWPSNGSMRQAVQVRIPLRKPVILYDEQALSGFRQARAAAWRTARRMLELSPSRPMSAVPHDWSDDIDALCTNGTAIARATGAA